MNLLATQLLTPLSELAERSRTASLDAIVIGGGTSGVVSAITLAERGLSVAVLEAGPLLLLTHATSTDLRFEPPQVSALRRRVEYSAPHASGAEFGPLVGCFGGRGMFWNGAAPRMEDHDFAAWPISLHDLEPHYQWAERQLRVNTRYGDTPLAQALLRTLRGHDRVIRSLPFAIDAGATENGWLRGTIGNAMTILLRSRLLWRAQAPLRLAGQAMATRLRFDPSQRRVTGVEVIDRTTGARYELAARSVVLAAGAFESTRLALVSEAPDRSGRLGTGIAEHLFSRTNFQIPLRWYDAARREVALLHLPARPGRAFQIEVHAPAGLLFNASEDRPWQPELTRDYAAMVRSFGSVTSRAESRIVPSAGDGPGGYVVHLEYTPADLALRGQMHEAIARIGELLDAPAATIEDLPPGRSYHEAGGTAMAVTAEGGVTDGFGRFHLCPTLVAADAAAWPSIAAANPHLTIAAHARRAAQQLGADLTAS